MATDNVQAQIAMMKAVVEPWVQGLADPAKAQEIVLERLLKGYSQTEYGRNHKSENVGSYADYRKAFPVQTYKDFKPYIDKVLAGDTYALLYEEPVCIGLTKGTTGEPKLFPFTSTQLKSNLGRMMRGMYTYSLTKNNFLWMSGYGLNLTGSSKVGTIKVGNRELMYGYSSAIQTRLIEENSKVTQKVIPTQDEIDTIPGEPSKETWEKRYEFAYQKARDINVTWSGMTPNVVVGFGRYLLRKHHISPKDIWKIQVLGSGGFANLYTRFAPPIHALYGKSVDIQDSYVSTEGGYLGLQIDDKKAWSPFYDQVFYEVQTINGIKPMHEMYPGEIGSLIFSTQSLPRYRIGDLILAFEAPYFQCIGRENTRLHPYHFGRLTGESPYNFSKPKDLVSWR
jgi:ABC-type cobalt transport system substrate-binding protein